MNHFILKSFDFNSDSFGLFETLRREPHAFFLDSNNQDGHNRRYSFIGFDPFDVFAHKGKGAVDLLRKKYSQYAGESPARLTSPHTPLVAGIVGCLGYDYGLYHEKIKLSARDDLGLPDAFFGFYDCILTVDHFKKKLFITSTGLPEKNELLREKRARERLNNIVRKIMPCIDGGGVACEEYFEGPSDRVLEFQCNFSKEGYEEAVRKALDHISRGDIYQVNLSQRFAFDLAGHDFHPSKLYKALRDYAPVAFGGYLDCGDFTLISNSPERFLHLNNGTVRTRPMKGTRPRGESEGEDERLRRELQESAKEKAELLMITDLLRNDLGRVCAYGSVRVREMRTIEEYRYVFQATSTIEGVLKKNADCFDLLEACFPGGSITGCPKIRSMEVIEELEPTRRGMYTGTMGYIAFNGDMDLNILIRTLVARRDKLYFQVGSGIVADSIPEREYEETLVKAKSIRSSIRKILSMEKQAA